MKQLSGEKLWPLNIDVMIITQYTTCGARKRLHSRHFSERSSPLGWADHVSGATWRTCPEHLKHVTLIDIDTGWMD